MVSINTDFGAGALGVLFGFVASYLVTSALVEVSINPFFSCLFGVGFLCLGGIILLRAFEHQKTSRQANTKSTNMLLVFACLIILSGLSCFFLERNWFHHLSTAAKVPMYSLLGVSVSFSITFAFVDLLNFFGGDFELASESPLRDSSPINSTKQVLVLVVGSLLVGLLFGCFFGLLKVGDDPTASHKRLVEDRHVCTPIGLITGGVCGVMIRRLRHPDNRKGHKTERVNYVIA
eukprot:Filipodium_phascolosomae@DN1891_c0_g1_i1.p1